MAIRIDQDARRMLVAQGEPTDGFRPQQAHEHVHKAAAYLSDAQHQMNLIAAELAGGQPISKPLGQFSDFAASVVWELSQAMASMGLSMEAVLGAVRERTLTGVMFDIEFLVKSQVYVAVGPVAGVEVAGDLTAGLPIAGDEVPSYAVTPEPPPETPSEETPP